MKKIVVLMMTAVMMLSLAACSSVPKEKLAEVDSLIAKLETLVEDASKEVEKTNNTGYEDVQEYYDTTIEVINELDVVFDDIKTAWEENKDVMDEEQVDDAIKELKNLEKQAQEVKQNAIDEAAVIGDAIAENEALPESITVPVEISNQTGIDIHVLALSPSGNSEWGENLITEVIANEETVQGELVFTADTLIWDVLVQDGDGNELTFMGVDFTNANTDNAKLILEAGDDGEYYATVS